MRTRRHNWGLARQVIFTLGAGLAGLVNQGCQTPEQENALMFGLAGGLMQAHAGNPNLTSQQSSALNAGAQSAYLLSNQQAQLDAAKHGRSENSHKRRIMP